MRINSLTSHKSKYLRDNINFVKFYLEVLESVDKIKIESKIFGSASTSACPASI